MTAALSAYAHDPSAYAPPFDGLTASERAELLIGGVDMSAKDLFVHGSQDTHGVAEVTAGAREESSLEFARGGR